MNECRRRRQSLEQSAGGRSAKSPAGGQIGVQCTIYRGAHAVQCTNSTVTSCSVYIVLWEKCRAFQLTARREAACCRLKAPGKEQTHRKAVGESTKSRVNSNIRSFPLAYMLT